jgi:glycosyltransferase involved in cell wall biosynthesis
VNIPVSKAVAYLRRHGPRATLRALRHGKKVDVTWGAGRHIFLPPFTPESPPGGPAAHTVNWFIPPFRGGAGGHLNIFRFVRHLEARGYECRIIMGTAPPGEDAARIQARICALFGTVRAQVYLGFENAPAAYACVATGWGTAYALRRLLGAQRYFYFVQDFEPWFYPAGSDAALAEATYRFGFIGITAGGWLASRLHADYGMQTHAVGFSYDRALYSGQGRPAERKRRVFFYARAATQRRGFELGLMALRHLCASLPDVEVVLAGMDPSGYDVPFRHVSLGQLTLAQLPAVYRSCDVALVLSMTNLSLLPLELMACGTPVVSNRGPWVEWLLSEQNTKLADATVEGLSAALRELLTDEAQWRRLQAGGLALAESTDWAHETKRFADVLAEHGCVPNSVAVPG